MTSDAGILLLCTSSVAVAVMHTLAGPDHYVPFVAMARARHWSRSRTAWITLACGAGHIGSSALLGVIAAGLGIELQRIAQIESMRGSLATWLLMVFGALYFAWGLRRAARTGGHVHGSGQAEGDHGAGRSITPWVLFAIFVFGPCEPMIPLVMVPAAAGDWLGVGMVSLVFGVVTLLTMLATVLLALYGVQRIRLRVMERYTHALAGLTLLLTGGAMAVFGL